MIIERIVEELRGIVPAKPERIGELELATRIYGRLFAFNRRETVQATKDPTLVDRLMSVVADVRTVEEGYRTAQVVGSGRFVSDGSLRLWVDGGEVADVAANGQLRLRMPCGRAGPKSGYFHVVSTAGRIDPRRPSYKLYINVAVHVRPLIVERLLGLRSCVYEAKMMTSLSELRRPDAMVVYVGPESATRVAAAVLAQVRENPRERTGRVPLLVRRLAPGVGVAESPRSVHSYGQHRSHVLARAVLNAWRAGLPIGNSWIGAIRRTFRAVGLRAEEPWRKELSFSEFDQL